MLTHVGQLPSLRYDLCFNGCQCEVASGKHLSIPDRAYDHLDLWHHLSEKDLVPYETDRNDSSQQKLSDHNSSQRLPTDPPVLDSCICSNLPSQIIQGRLPCVWMEHCDWCQDCSIHNDIPLVVLRWKHTLHDYHLHQYEEHLQIHLRLQANSRCVLQTENIVKRILLQEFRENDSWALVQDLKAKAREEREGASGADQQLPRSCCQGSQWRGSEPDDRILMRRLRWETRHWSDKSSFIWKLRWRQ